MICFRYSIIILLLLCSTSCRSTENHILDLDKAPNSVYSYAFVSQNDANTKFKPTAPGSQEIIKQANHILKMKPFPLERVHVEGVLDFKDATNIKDWSKTLSLAIAYRLTNNNRYLLKATEFFIAWLDLYKLSKNYIAIDESCAAYPIPNPGIQCVDPIDDTQLSTFVLAYDILKSDLSTELNNKMFRFMRNMAMSYLADIEMRDLRADSRSNTSLSHYLYTNWHSHRIKLAIMSAFETGDTMLINRSIQAFKKQISNNIVYPGNINVYNAHIENIELSREQKSYYNKNLTIINNGSVFDFYQRNAIHYVVYDLEPLLQSAFIGYANGFGENLYSYNSENGARLENAIKWLLPFAESKVYHLEFTNSSVSFDAIRSKTGHNEYSGIWNPIQAKGLYTLAVIFDRSLMTENIMLLLDKKYEGDIYDPWFNNKFATRELLNYVWNAISAR